METSIQEIVSLVRHQLVARYFNVASIVILIYDTLENFSDEVDLIWRQPWNVVKALYIASRYLAFVDAPIMMLYLFDSSLGPEICHRIYITTSYFTILIACAAELVLLIRVYAIWKQSTRILTFLCFVSFALVITSILNLNIHNNIKTLMFTHSPVPSIIPCFLPNIQVRAALDMGCLVLLDFTITVFTVWGGYRFWKEDA